MNSSVNNAYWYLKWLQSNKSVPPQGCLQTMMQNKELVQREYSSSRVHLSLLHTLPMSGTTPSSSHNCFSNVAWVGTISQCQKTSSGGEIGYFWVFFALRFKFAINTLCSSPLQISRPPRLICLQLLWHRISAPLKRKRNEGHSNPEVKQITILSLYHVVWWLLQLSWQKKKHLCYGPWSPLRRLLQEVH